MNRLRLAAWATVAGLGLVSGCASPCGGGPLGRFGLFHRQPECCPSCSPGCAPACGPGGCGVGEGPLLGDAGPGIVPSDGIPLDAGSGVPIIPQPGPFQQVPPQGILPPGGPPPGTLPPAAPPPPAPDRLLPVPQATPVPANPSSRAR